MYWKILECNPVIAAVRDDQSVEKAINSKADVVFILSGNLINIHKVVDRIKGFDKKVFIHIDLIEGLAGIKQRSIFFKNMSIRMDTSQPRPLLPNIRNSRFIHYPTTVYH
jgi:glycerol-3-phosphate responsive antiterminator